MAQRPTTLADLDAAVTALETDTHVQNTDIKLDNGQPNEVTAADLRTHLDDLTIHRIINDAGTGTIDLWSADQIQSAIDAATIASALKWKGAWDANANTPALSDGSGSEGDYYRVSVAGTTSLDGITDWQVGDHLIMGTTSWFKIDNSDQVTSVNTQQGAVVLDTGDIAESGNLYYTEARVDANTNVAANTADRHVAASLGGVGGDTTNDTLNLSVQTLTVNLATTSTDGAMSAADKLKLDGVEAGATADQIATEVPFTPTTSADWSPVPTESGGAMDQLASRVDTLEADTHADPGTFAGAGSTGIVPDPVTATGKVLTDNGTWQPTGSGDMLASVYDPTTVSGDAFDADNHAYSNATSGLTATNTQAAIDEIDGRVDALETDTHSHANLAALDLVSGTNTGDNLQATEILKGIAEIATQAETDAGTDDTRFVTPAKLAAYVNIGDGHTHGNLASLDLVSGTNTGDEVAATTTTSGIVETATQAEVDAGTDTSRYITPATLANYANLGDGHTHGNLAALDLVAGTNTGDEVAATELVQGIAEIATQAEVDTGTDTTRYITPATLSNYSGLGDGHVHANLAALNLVSGTNTGDEVQATETIAGIGEVATQAETDAGTDDLRFITPLKLSSYPFPDELVKVSANDTTPGDLEAKVVAGTGISISTLAEGANETLRISSTVSGADITIEDEGTPLTTAVTLIDFAGDGVTVTEPIADQVLVTIPIPNADAVPYAPTTPGDWADPDPTTVEGALDEIASLLLDQDCVDMIAGALGDQWESGLMSTANSPADSMIDVSAGVFYINCVKYSHGGTADFDFTADFAALSGGERQVASVYIDATNVVQRVLGATETGTKKAVPAAIPADSICLAYITLEKDDGEVTTERIEDCRMNDGAGGVQVTDELVKVSADDTSSKYLEGAIAAGSDITLTTINPGADEMIQVAVTAGAFAAVSHGIDTHSDVDTTTVAPSNGDRLEWNGANWVPVTPSAGGDPTGDTVTTAGDTTASTAYVLVTGLTITPASGTYLVWLTGSMAHSANNLTIYTSIYSAGSLVTDTERQAANRQAGNSMAYSSGAKVTVNGSQSIEGRWKVTSGTATHYGGTLQILKVA